MKNYSLLRLQSTLFGTVIIVLTSLLMGCTDNTLDETTNNETANQATTEPSEIITPNESMSIEGTIIEVMESWPLQLSVETTDGQYSVELLSETTITKDGNAVDAGSLEPNIQVVITGEASANQDNAMIANSIEIQ